jgi:hypothetical protein
MALDGKLDMFRSRPSCGGAMSSVLTSREIADMVRNVYPHVEKLTEDYKQASIEHLRAKRRYDIREADEFLKAKNAGATDEMAKRIALIKASDEKEAMEDAAAEKAAARLGSEAWQHLLDVYSALSHVLNRELKAFQASGQ